MKAKELRVMSDADLNAKIVELKNELMKSNSQIATGTLPKSPSRVREMKRTIAQIFTIKNEKSLGINQPNQIEQKPKQENQSQAKTAAPKAAAKKGGSKKE